MLPSATAAHEMANEGLALPLDFNTEDIYYGGAPAELRGVTLLIVRN